jgi:organic hydroperoxide reductase OsmC/OhrA
MAMQPFPHHYGVVAAADATSDVTLDSTGLPTLPSAPPTDFGGPGNRWSPETLLVAAVVDCFVLNFRGIASVSRLPWTSLTCEATGTVDRVERVTQFTAFEIRARLRVPAGANADQAQRLLVRAEQTCLITNSLKVAPHLDATVEVVTS